MFNFLMADSLTGRLYNVLCTSTKTINGGHPFNGEHYINGGLCINGEHYINGSLCINGGLCINSKHIYIVIGIILTVAYTLLVDFSLTAG